MTETSEGLAQADPCDSFAHSCSISWMSELAIRNPVLLSTVCILRLLLLLLLRLDSNDYDDYYDCCDS